MTGMDAGMPNAQFSDFPYIPQAMVERMEVSPMEAIVCSTKNSAECLALSAEIGTLQTGKAADVVVVNGDPTKDIRALQEPDTIVARGEMVKRNGELLI